MVMGIFKWSFILYFWEQTEVWYCWYCRYCYVIIIFPGGKGAGAWSWPLTSI